MSTWIVGTLAAVFVVLALLAVRKNLKSGGCSGGCAGCGGCCHTVSPRADKK